MPRTAKPPAVPIEMPRTEGDLDRLMKAVEEHMSEGDRLGRMLNNEQAKARDVLNLAAQADDKLYKILDDIQSHRHDERQDEIDREPKP